MTSLDRCEPAATPLAAGRGCLPVLRAFVPNLPSGQGVVVERESRRVTISHLQLVTSDMDWSKAGKQDRAGLLPDPVGFPLPLCTVPLHEEPHPQYPLAELLTRGTVATGGWSAAAEFFSVRGVQWRDLHPDPHLRHCQPPRGAMSCCSGAKSLALLDVRAVPWN